MSARKAAAKRYFDDVLSTRRLETADEFLTEDVTVTAPGESMAGIAELKEFLTAGAIAFPHRDVVIDEQVEEGDHVACVFRLVMEHVGEYQGLPPTGKTVDVTGVNIFRFKEDRIDEIRVFYNAMEVMEQLGISNPAAQT